MTFTKPQFEIGRLIEQYRQPLEERGYLNAHQKRVFTNLQNCRTQKLGYHREECDNEQCKHGLYSYNSCRDRHCPKCNGMKREKWLMDREQDLMPVKYFHTVFTVPEQVNDLFVHYPVPLYNLLFTSAWETIRQFGLDHKHLGAQTGMVAILHTWGQNLAFHPHVHCIVPGGGLTRQNTWKHTKGDGKFLYPVKALSKVFRGKFCDGLINLHNNKVIDMENPLDPQHKYLHPFYRNKWVVYAKLPMHNPKQVIDYLGRYTHRIAISNHRIKNVQDGEVTFSWFNYKTSKAGELTLTAVEFLRRFAMHILPPGFMKIRHYGILGARNKKTALAAIRNFLDVKAPESTKQMDWKAVFEMKFGHDPTRCPVCRNGQMQRVASVMATIRGSPKPDFKPNTEFYNQK